MPLKINIGSYYQNLKVFLIVLIVRILIRKKDREFLLKFLEFKFKIISNNAFQGWMMYGQEDEEEDG